MIQRIKTFFAPVSRFEWLVFMLGVFLSLMFWYLRWDVAIHHWALEETFTSRTSQDIFGYLSRVGQGWFKALVCMLFAAYYFYRRHNKGMAKIWAWSPVLFLGGALINYILKAVVGRPRPKMMWQGYYEPEWLEWASRMHSYPSGHTFTSFAMAGVLWNIYPRLRPVMIVLATILGLARVGIGSHFVGDVIAGAVLGYIIGRLLGANVLDKMKKDV